MIRALEISLIITAIYVSMWEGMIFGWFRELLSKRIERIFGGFGCWIRKPLFECLICMGGIYALLLYPVLFGFDFIEITKTMLLVIGINTLISGLISRLYD